MRKWEPRHPEADRVRLHATVGRTIRLKRAAAGISLRMLAPLVGVSTNYLDKIEEGQSPCPLHVLVRLADVFDCTLDDLVPVQAA